jgi:hypothetical protein
MSIAPMAVAAVYIADAYSSSRKDPNSIVQGCETKTRH